MRTSKKETLSNSDIASRLILSAINMDDVLADILKVEIRVSKKKLMNKDFDISEVSKFNSLLKYVIYALTLTDEKISRGLEIYNLSDKNEEA